MSDSEARQAGKAVVWRALTHLSSRGLSSLRTLILGWMLTREDFGALAVAVSALELLLSLSNFGITQALVQTKDPEADQYDTAWTIQMVRSVVIATILALSGGLVAGWFGQPDAGAVVSVLAVRTVIDAGASIGLVKLQRRLEFRALAIVGLARGLTDIMVSVSLAPFLGVWALVIGQLAGASAACLASYIVAPWRPRFMLRRDLGRPLVQFGRWVFLAVAIATATNTVLHVFISRSLGAAALGSFFMAVRLGLLIPNAIGLILDDVGMAVHAARQDELDYRGRVLRLTTLNTFAVLAPALVTGAVVADRLVPSLIGDEWREAAWPIGLLLIGGLIGVFHDAAGTMFLGTGHPHYRTRLESVRAAFVLAAAAVLIPRWEVVGAAIALVIGEAIMAIMAMPLVGAMTRLRIRDITGPSLAIVGASVVGAGLARLAAASSESDAVVWIATAVGALIGYVLLLKLDRRVDLGLRRSATALAPRLAGMVGLDR